MGEVLVVEHLGDVTYLYVKVAGGDTLILETEGDRPVVVGDRVPIYVDGNLCHLFDANDNAIPKAERHHLTLEKTNERQPIQQSEPQRLVNKDRHPAE